MPGPSTSSADAARARLDARLAARNSLIQRSLDNHAERVAKKLRTEGPTPHDAAACRMAALRDRVAARAAAASARHSDSGGALPSASTVNHPATLLSMENADHNVANAATRVARHAILGTPTAGDARQLSA